MATKRMTDKQWNEAMKKWPELKLHPELKGIIVVDDSSRARPKPKPPVARKSRGL